MIPSFLDLLGSWKDTIISHQKRINKSDRTETAFHQTKYWQRIGSASPHYWVYCPTVKRLQWPIRANKRPRKVITMKEESRKDNALVLQFYYIIGLESYSLVYGENKRDETDIRLPSP